jgi:hypothetical protein
MWIAQKRQAAKNDPYADDRSGELGQHHCRMFEALESDAERAVPRSSTEGLVMTAL